MGGVLVDGYGEGGSDGRVSLVWITFVRSSR
jgi:hypothetical protein